MERQHSRRSIDTTSGGEISGLRFDRARTESFPAQRLTRFADQPTLLDRAMESPAHAE